MTDVVTEIEQQLAAFSRDLTEPGERECLRCYLLRMLAEFGCDNTHRWTERWRSIRAPGRRRCCGGWPAGVPAAAIAR